MPGSGHFSEAGSGGCRVRLSSMNGLHWYAFAEARRAKEEGGRRKQYPSCSGRPRRVSPTGRANARPMINSAIPIISPCAQQDDGFRKGSTHPTARRANQQKPVQPPLQKYFCFSETKIRLYDLPSRPTRGAVRDRHGRGAGCGGRGCADRRTALMRTAKTCGPDAPTLASSS